MLLISVVVFATGVTVFINARQRVQSQPMLQPSAAATTAAAPSATSSVPVAFQQAPCPFTPGRGMKEGSNMRCGLLTVPEDHSIARGASIQLAVAIFKSPVADTSAAPVIYLDGGPGGATLSLIGPQITVTNRQIVTLGHDMIFFDQRGAGYSRPSLSCPELERVESYQSQVIAIRNCHDRLIRSGINLSAYTTLQNAADVHDLISAV
ncbi:MAG: hypothetical protein IMW89_09240 [Ktedonobacteraceae bacterium]|nr:hypothetical protein [Ktedonobacteraceae bacterium]